MNTNIATSREQSKRLLQCGVPAESADMAMQAIITNGHYQIAEENGAETLASASVKAADALIAELNKKKDE